MAHTHATSMQRFEGAAERPCDITVRHCDGAYVCAPRRRRGTWPPRRPPRPQRPRPPGSMQTARRRRAPHAAAAHARRHPRRHCRRRLLAVRCRLHRFQMPGGRTGSGRHEGPPRRRRFGARRRCRPVWASVSGGGGRGDG
eukprot:358742-Chlamydomonas_euryale.AAC.2